MDKLEEIEAILSQDEYECERLLDLSLDRDAEIRLRSLEALYPFSDTQEVVERVKHAISDPDELVRAAALELLGDWVETSSVQTIITCLNDEEWLVRAYAAIALGMIGDPKAIAALEKQVNCTNEDEELSRYYMALWCLGKTQYKMKFLKYLAHPYYRVRCAVANLLLECQHQIEIDDEIIKHLKEALEKEPTTAARSSLQEVLQELSDEECEC